MPRFSHFLPLLALSLCLLGTVSASPQDSIGWQQQNKGMQTLWTVFFSDSLHGWAGGNAWTLYRTVNGGANWTQLPQPSSDTVYALSFEDDTAGWAATGSGRIYRTLNGGNSWTQSFYQAGWISGLSFHGKDTGWACGSIRNGLAYNPILYRTRNRGQSWETITVGSGPYSLKSIRSPDGLKVFAAGFNYLTQSNDAGGVYSAPVYFPPVVDSAFRNSNGYINVADFPDPMLGFGVGRYGHIIKSTNGGVNWRSVFPQNFVWFEDIRFAGISKGIVAGERGAVVSSADSGNTWTLRYPRHQPTLNAPWFRALHVMDSAHVWMVGDSGLIMKGSFPPAPVGISGKPGRKKNYSFTAPDELIFFDLRGKSLPEHRSRALP